MSENIGCVIDIETTGLKPGVHEIIELALILHDENFIPKDSFICKIRPIHFELIDPKALEINRLDITTLKNESTPSQIRNALYQWHEEIVNGKKLLPLGHNYSFDKSFLNLFLGDYYNNIFDHHCRDTFILAQALKDRGILKTNNIKLTDLGKYFKLPEQIHRAEQDARLCLSIYKKLLTLIK
jgi:DNA polymerase-3 subunit epsilon